MQAVNSTFSGGRVDLDGNEFIRCRFENVTLVFGATAPVVMRECVFANVGWELTGAAGLTMYFLASLYHGAGPGGAALVEGLFNQIRTPPAAASSPAAPALTAVSQPARSSQ